MLTSPDLAALDGITHGFFTRAGGVSQGIYASLNVGHGSDDDQEAVRENRTRIKSLLGLPNGALVSPHQHHSATAIVVTEPPLPLRSSSPSSLFHWFPLCSIGLHSVPFVPFGSIGFHWIPFVSIGFR